MSNKGNTPQNFLVFQVDLTNHTEWVSEKEGLKHSPKKELAISIIDTLKDYGFARYSWSGDGGFFISDPEGKTNYDFVVDCADMVYDLFEKWKKDYSDLNTQLLDLRISIDGIPIIMDEYLGFCTSVELNDFLKNERTYSVKGFSIGEQIKEKLTVQKRDRFVDEFRTGKTGLIRFYNDSRHKLQKRKQHKFGIHEKKKSS